jgi:hypothetical protein
MGSDSSRDVVARAMIEALGARYPGRFDPEQTEQIRQSVSHLLDVSSTLKAYPLANADEPDPIFRACRH